MTNREIWHGMPIDLNDKHGTPIHVGDTLRFEPREWGGDCVFTVEFAKGEVVLCGSPGDMDTWCEVIIRYDGSKVRD